MIKSITIITGQHLVSNPRVWKEANALSDFGYNVTIYTTWFSELHINEDKELINSTVSYCPSISIIQKHISKFHLLYAKSIKKIANLIYILFKIDSIYQLLYLPNIQLKNIKKKKADLFICHQEAGLLLGIKLLKAGYKVAFDFEDWYSEDYLKSDRPLKLLRDAEFKALQQGEYVTCPSHSMAATLTDKYKVKKPIQVIFNTFPDINEMSKEQNKITNSVVWFSQTIGPERGLESFFESVRHFEIPLEIHLIGNCTSSFEKQLKKLVDCTPHIIKLHPLMKHSTLMKFLRKFKVGLALENNLPQNKDLTISNKILTYLQLNLYVIATTTTGQLELNESFKSKITYVDLTNPIDTQNKLGFALHNLNQESTSVFPYKYSWEFQQSKILSLVNNSISA